MTALPPPEPKIEYDRLGFEVGLIYCLASVGIIGLSSLMFPLAGFLLGVLVGALDD